MGKRLTAIISDAADLLGELETGARYQWADELRTAIPRVEALEAQRDALREVLVKIRSNGTASAHIPHRIRLEADAAIAETKP